MVYDDVMQQLNEQAKSSEVVEYHVVLGVRGGFRYRYHLFFARRYVNKAIASAQADSYSAVNQDGVCEVFDECALFPADGKRPSNIRDEVIAKAD